MKLPHMNDGQIPFTIWHNDDRLIRVVRHIIEVFKPDRWVETGTHMGWTSAWIAENYPHLPIYTVEVMPEYYRKSVENLAAYPNVYPSFGNSVDFMKKLQPIFNRGLSVFWLDAHWWPPVPLREECKVVASLDKYVCIIDDFGCWDPFFEGDVFMKEPVSNVHDVLMTSKPKDDGTISLVNDLSFVADILGKKCLRPTYAWKAGMKGYGIFSKNEDRELFPLDILKAENLGVEEIRTRSDEYLKKEGVQ